MILQSLLKERPHFLGDGVQTKLFISMPYDFLSALEKFDEIFKVKLWKEGIFAFLAKKVFKERFSSCHQSINSNDSSYGAVSFFKKMRKHHENTPWWKADPNFGGPQTFFVGGHHDYLIPDPLDFRSQVPLELQGSHLLFHQGHVGHIFLQEFWEFIIENIWNKKNF